MADSLTISGGTLDNSVIGGSTPAAGTFTTLTGNGNVTLGDAASDTVAVTGTVQNASPFVFEGATDDTNETTLAITDPTADRTITLPDANGTVALTSDLNTINLSSNETITGNWVNTANPWADNEVADSLTISGGTLDNSVIGGATPAAGTFTNLTGNGNVNLGDAVTDTVTVTGVVQGANPLAFEGDTPDDFETTFAITNPTADNTITFKNESGTVALTSDIPNGGLAAKSTINNDDWSGTDLSVANGGTGASDISAARTNLGVAIGTDVQAYDAQLADIAGLTPTDSTFIVGDGNNFVTEDASTARTSLGLGTIAEQNSTSVDIDGGAIDGTAIGAASASTGKFSTLTTTGATNVEGATVTLGKTGTAGQGTIVLHDNQTDDFTTTIKSNADVNADFTLTLPADDGDADQVLKTNGSGNLSWTTITDDIGANTALSNLGSVAINTSLVSDTDNADDLGTSSKKWKDLYLAGNLSDGTNSLTVANSKTAYDGVNAATNANTVSTIVKRDGSGNFSAGTITATLTGNVTGNLTGDVTGNATGLANSGQVAITSTQNSASSVYIRANGGTSESVKIHSDQGTGTASVEITSDAGGITANAATGKTISMQNNSTEMFKVDGNGASVNSGKAFYFGDEGTNASWRIMIDGDNLKFQRRVSGIWTTKLIINN